MVVIAVPISRSSLVLSIPPSHVIILIITVLVFVIVTCAVSWGPLHFVFFLEATPGIGEPRGDLGQGHLGDDGQHDLLTFGGVRVLDVFIQPGF